ncbi:MAG TPA: sulfotransferase family 2 domain-containing protein [Sphingomicrobium sp.]
MIISTLRKFVFVAIPKTGTHAVRRALRAHMGPQDMEQVGLFVQRSLPIPALAQIGHGHITLEQLRPHVKADAWGSLFKFAFVRNPFDRFVSYCAFMTREGDAFQKDPRAVMRSFLANPPLGHILFHPQHSFITDASGAVLADYVGRVEEMQKSYDEISARIGIPTTKLEKVNASKRRNYREYFDEPLIEGVAKLYARDLELFGYEF